MCFYVTDDRTRSDSFRPCAFVYYLIRKPFSEILTENCLQKTLQSTFFQVSTIISATLFSKWCMSSRTKRNTLTANAWRMHRAKCDRIRFQQYFRSDLNFSSKILLHIYDNSFFCSVRSLVFVCATQMVHSDGEIMRTSQEFCILKVFLHLSQHTSGTTKLAVWCRCVRARVFLHT